MTALTKNILYAAIALLIVVMALVLYWQRQTPPSPLKVEGQTMGTTYSVTYFDGKHRDFKKQIDSLLQLVNASINTYDSSSEVSRFNGSRKGIALELPFLLPPLRTSANVFAASNGAFDPTVMPLVNAWGFGSAKPQRQPGEKDIAAIMQHVGFEKIILSNDSVKKIDSDVQLDFGGIGQGYGADVVAEFLHAQGINDMLVELGGEGLAIGKNRETGKAWQIGIIDPRSTVDEQFFKAYITLSGRSFTTSGNYFNYRVVDGKKYSHTIDPQTGYPATRAILSASVFADDAATADAWATAFMVMGHEQAMRVLSEQPKLDAILMYTGDKGAVEVFITDGIKPDVILEK